MGLKKRAISCSLLIQNKDVRMTADVEYEARKPMN